MVKHGYPEILPLPQMGILPRNPEAILRRKPPNKCAEQQEGHSKPIRVGVVLEEDIREHVLTANDKRFPFWHVELLIVCNKSFMPKLRRWISVVSPLKTNCPLGNFTELNRTVTCRVLKANDRLTSSSLPR
ncbi:hypothetical protein TNCV_4359191 [Trichonephila clavipes]|uniref:Uncharacterized protein n=1 Tax=Trichonephila clavipes TaxID=2585209 RepID=A0A8X6W9S7_TRICX|nr:hypothetical protein TNCV_4359191 [Trichonephila clavipes]